MKKLGLLILAALMCLSVLSGCAGKAGDTGKNDEPVDRLTEFLDQSGDADKLTARFFDFVLYQDGSSSRRKCGDATLLTSPDGKLMLVDTFTPTAGPYLVDRLQEMGITRIDYLVFSHNHADHIGGAPSVINQFEIGQIYMTADESDESNGSYYKKLMTAVNTKGIPVTHLWEGDTFMFGDQVEVTCYNPPKGYDFYANPSGVEVRNNSSMALRFVYGESSYLLAGDLYSGAEARLVADYGDALQSDVVKMNHHGYEATNTLDWVRATTPLVAVATMGVDNNKELTYGSVGARTFFNHADGNILISTPGDGTYEVITEIDRNNNVLDCENLSEDGHYHLS